MKHPAGAAGDIPEIEVGLFNDVPASIRSACAGPAPAAAATPAPIVLSAAPVAQIPPAPAAPMEPPFGGPSPALTVLLFLTRWLGAVFVFLGVANWLKLYTQGH